MKIMKVYVIKIIENQDEIKHNLRKINKFFLENLFVIVSLINSI